MNVIQIENILRQYDIVRLFVVSLHRASEIAPLVGFSSHLVRIQQLKHIMMTTFQKNNLKKLILTFIFFVLSTISLSAQNDHEPKGQGSEKEAWEWEKKVGVIKGFNAPFEAYPGMKMTEILEKAASLGYNSIRTWLPSDAEQCVKFLHRLLDDASENHLTLSPVLNLYGYFALPDKVKATKKIKNYLSKVIGEFRDDPRIIFWDFVNEPALRYSQIGTSWEKEALGQIEWSKNIVKWARESDLAQPITTSALFLTEHVYDDNKVHRALKELAAMSDVHNFHLYDLSVNRMKAIDDMVALLKSLGNRPIICTEAVARTRGGTFARSLTVFSKYHIHFYNWGMYTNDRNWDVAWGLSSFEPYEPWFHDVLHPDGYPYDWRDIKLVQEFHFAKEGEQTDPGAEVTERWNKWRAWKWMATGPVKGILLDMKTGISELKKKLDNIADKGYNSVRVSLSFDEWKSDSLDYYSKLDTLLQMASTRFISVMPLLLSDKDAEHTRDEIDRYVSSLVKKYGFDTRIIAWELYNHPAESVTDVEKIKSLLTLVFQVARFEFPNQPLTATPAVSVKKFAPDFDYLTAFDHGHTNGWN